MPPTSSSEQSVSDAEPAQNAPTNEPSLETARTLGRGLLRAFTSLRQRNYRLYWFGQMISLTGSAMQNIGLTWLVLELTHSPVQLGVVGALQALPILLFSLI